MIVGVVKEIKDNENRVALTPQGARTLTAAGHGVRVQQGAGTGAGFPDREYEEAGAVVVDGRTAWQSELVVKVKEPQPEEYDFLQGQILFTYLHLSGVPASLTEALLQSATSAIAYETVEDREGRLPLLAPMSAVAGNMALTMGSYYLARVNGGRGVQLGRVLGKKNGRVLIIGDGVVGRHAAAVAVAMGAMVVMAGRNPEGPARLPQEVARSLVYIPVNPGTYGGRAAGDRSSGGRGFAAWRPGSLCGERGDGKNHAAGQRHRRRQHRSGRLCGNFAAYQPFPSGL